LYFPVFSSPRPIWSRKALTLSGQVKEGTVM
jgi:hypothetical protein